MRVMIAGGGTGGHVIPALAIAGALKSAYQAEVCFIGTARGMETRLVPQAGYALELIDVGQLNRVSLATQLKTLVALPRGILHCLGLLRRWQPQVVVGVGGYASGPAMLAALLRRVPTLAFEPNAVPGMANRLIGKRISAAAVNFAPTRVLLPQCRGHRHSRAGRVLRARTPAGGKRAPVAGHGWEPGCKGVKPENAGDCQGAAGRCPGPHHPAPGRSPSRRDDGSSLRSQRRTCGPLAGPGLSRRHATAICRLGSDSCPQRGQHRRGTGSQRQTLAPGALSPSRGRSPAKKR